MDTKKPATTVPATTTAKPATTRPSLPSLSPNTSAKSGAADLKPATSAGDPVAPVKAVQPADEVTHATLTTFARPSLPSLSPLPEAKPAAASIQPPNSAVTTATPEKANQPASVTPQPTAGPTSPTKATETKPAVAPASPAKPVEKLGPKLRRKDEILKALREGSKVEKVDGLFRIVNPNGTKNATSKRRILSLESQKLLIASADGNSFALNLEADKKAQEPKAVAATAVKEAK